MNTITPTHGSSEGLDLTPVVLTGKDGKSYHLIETRTNRAAAQWQMKHHWRVIEGAFRDQFNPKRKTGVWRVQVVS